MNTCGTCKYRGDRITTEDDTYDYIEKETTYFFCNWIRHDTDWKYKQGQQALLVDGSGYYAALCVEDDFGCVKWEVK